MPWLTPDSIPEGGICRPLSIPADSVWLALVSGALTELTLKYNWQQFGSLTVDETVAKMQEIVDSYYAGACACTLAGGGHIIRIGDHGHIEELGDDGTWIAPTDEYVIPAPEARSGGTADNQNCLAAKNAVNVLQQLYETLSEQWGAHVSEAEALTELATAAVAIVGFEFAPITFGVAAFLFVAFATLYSALEYLGADLWDEAFSQQLECFLLACAMNDAGVVTFDWDCLMGKLNSLVDQFGLSEVQLRLYLQVTYLLYFVGGVDGLNLAARTTDITNDDCSFCPVEWCLEWFFTSDESLNGLSVFKGTWEDGNGYTGEFVDANSQSEVYLEALSLSETNFTHIEITYSFSGGGANRRVGFALYESGSPVLTQYGGADGSHVSYAWDGDLNANYLNFQLNSGTDATPAHLEHALIRGFGAPPDLGTECA